MNFPGHRRSGPHFSNPSRLYLILNAGMIPASTRVTPLAAIRRGGTPISKPLTSHGAMPAHGTAKVDGEMSAVDLFEAFQSLADVPVLAFGVRGYSGIDFHDVGNPPVAQKFSKPGKNFRVTVPSPHVGLIVHPGNKVTV